MVVSSPFFHSEHLLEIRFSILKILLAPRWRCHGFPFEGGIQTVMLQHSLEIFPLVRSTVFKKKTRPHNKTKYPKTQTNKSVFILLGKRHHGPKTGQRQLL